MTKDTKEDILKRQAGQQAAPTSHPPPPAYISQAIEESKKARVEPGDTNDTVLAEGSDSDFWKLVRGYIEMSMEKLKRVTAERMKETGFGLEEIGLRLLVENQLVGFGQDIINYVELRKKALEVKALEEQKKKVVQAKKDGNKDGNKA